MSDESHPVAGVDSIPVIEDDDVLDASADDPAPESPGESAPVSNIGTGVHPADQDDQTGTQGTSPDGPNATHDDNYAPSDTLGGATVDSNVDSQEIKTAHDEVGRSETSEATHLIDIALDDAIPAIRSNPRVHVRVDRPGSPLLTTRAQRLRWIFGRRWVKAVTVTAFTIVVLGGATIAVTTAFPDWTEHLLWATTPVDPATDSREKEIAALRDSLRGTTEAASKTLEATDGAVIDDSTRVALSEAIVVAREVLSKHVDPADGRTADDYSKELTSTRETVGTALAAVDESHREWTEQRDAQVRERMQRLADARATLRVAVETGFGVLDTTEGKVVNEGTRSALEKAIDGWENLVGADPDTTDDSAVASTVETLDAKTSAVKAATNSVRDSHAAWLDKNQQAQTPRPTGQPTPEPTESAQPTPIPRPTKEPSPPKRATETTTVTCRSQGSVTFNATGGGTVEVRVSGSASGSNSGAGSASVTVDVPAGGTVKGVATATTQVNLGAMWIGSCS